MKTNDRGRFLIGFDGADHVVYDRGEVVETMRRAYSERDYLRRPAEALFPPSFRTLTGGAS